MSLSVGRFDARNCLQLRRSIPDMDGLYISDVRVYERSAVHSASLNGIMVSFAWNATTDVLDLMFEANKLLLSQPFVIEWH